MDTATSLGMSNVHISESTHRYAVQVPARTAEVFQSQGISCDPLTAFTYEKPKPEDERDLDKGREIDERNNEIHEHNQRVVQLINPILVGLHHRPVTAHPPVTSYASEARRKYKEWLEDPTVRLREAIRYLAGRNRFDAATDLDDAPGKADTMAADEEQFRLIDHWKGHIPVGRGRNPSTWDGETPRDSAGNRVKWHQTDFHSFLKPHVIPENY